MAQSIIYKGQKYVRVDAKITQDQISDFKSSFGESQSSFGGGNGSYRYDVSGELNGKHFSFRIHSKKSGTFAPRDVYDERGVTSQEAREIASLMKRKLI